MLIKDQIRAASFAAGIAFVGIANAFTTYSVASLTLLCGNPQYEDHCSIYVHGVVETWMVKDAAGIDPYRFESRSNSPTFCDAIFDASDKELLQIVRTSLPTMNSGFASAAVMDALSKRLCSPAIGGR